MDSISPLLAACMSLQGAVQAMGRSGVSEQMSEQVSEHPHAGQQPACDLAGWNMGRMLLTMHCYMLSLPRRLHSATNHSLWPAERTHGMQPSWLGQSTSSGGPRSSSKHTTSLCVLSAACYSVLQPAL